MILCSLKQCNFEKLNFKKTEVYPKMKYGYNLSKDTISFKSRSQDMEEDLLKLANFDEIFSEDPKVIENGLRKLVLSLEDSDIFFDDELRFIAKQITNRKQTLNDKDLQKICTDIIEIIKKDYKID